MIKKEAEIFGLLFLGDGATISRCPLLNILVSAKKIPVTVLEIVDCQGHLADGNKRYGNFICNQFLNHMKEIDPEKKLSDIVMFDGASNVQLSGRILKVNYPKLTVMRGVEHTVSLFFNDVSKIPIVNKIISSHKMIYNIFGSVIYHKPHPIFKPKYQEFHIETLFYLVETRLEWLDISWGCTDTCGCGKFFKPLYLLLNSSVLLIISNSPNKLGTFMTMSHGKGAMYF